MSNNHKISTIYVAFYRVVQFDILNSKGDSYVP